MTHSLPARFEREKQAYWSMRDDLLNQNFGKWVAVVDAKIVAMGDKKMNVLKEAFSLTRSEVGYINRVGYEEVTKKKVSGKSPLGDMIMSLN